MSSQPSATTGNRLDLRQIGLIAVVVIVVCVNVVPAFLPREAPPYALSRSIWYIDFRYWSPWLSNCCWLIFVWAMVFTAINLLMPKNTNPSFWKRRIFYQITVGTLLAFFIWMIWRKHSALTFASMFTPITAPIYKYYVIPWADRYSMNGWLSPLFWLTTLLIIAFITWRVKFHIRACYNYEESSIWTT
jgi:hypothetical protein